MALRDILGQAGAVQFLRQTLANKRLAHAYLFYGPPGVGKKFAALQFIKVLYCDTAAADACDTCPACRKIMAHQHPDVRLLTAEESSIKIEQVRDLQRHLSYKPYEHRRITVIIDGGEFFTLPAANALLKTLEEPPANTLILLLTGNKDAIPVTITSRCQGVPFRTLPPVHLRTLLEQQGLTQEAAAQVAPLLEGRLDRLAAADWTQFLAMRQSAYQILQDMLHSQGAISFPQARKLASKREQCTELFRWLGLLCRDLTVLTTAPDTPLYNQDLRAELSLLATQVPLIQLFALFDRLQQLTLYLSMNLNPQLLFEQLLVQLPQAPAQSQATSTTPRRPPVGNKPTRRGAS
jgi:DNA polymerase-3 subunit delta'